MPSNCLSLFIYFVNFLISFVELNQDLLFCQVATLLGSHTELKEECEDFMTYIEKTGTKRINAFYVFLLSHIFVNLWIFKSCTGCSSQGFPI